MKAGSINEEEAVVELMGRDATAEFIGCRSKDRYGPSSASLCKQRSVSPSLVTHNSEGRWKWGRSHLAYLSYNVNSMMKVFTWVGAWKLLLLAFMLLSQPSLVAPGRLTKETLGDQVACGHDPSQLEEVNGEVLMNCIKPVYPAGTSPSTACLSCNRLDGPHGFIATGSGNNARDPASVCLPCFYADRAARPKARRALCGALIPRCRHDAPMAPVLAAHGTFAPCAARCALAGVGVADAFSS